MVDIQAPVKAAVRCSIILPAGSALSKLSEYLLYLSRLELPAEYELIVVNDHGLKIDRKHLAGLLPGLKVLDAETVSRQELLFDKAAMAASGKYLLMIRTFINFDKLVLEQSIDDLEGSAKKTSVSANRNFVLAESLYYRSVGGFATSCESFNLAAVGAESAPCEETAYCRNLCNEVVPVRCGKGSFIDPDVVVDSPALIKIGSNTIIRKGVVLRPENGEIIIGDNCVINHYCIFHAKGGIFLGDWTIVAPHCGFYAQNHTYARFDIPITKQPNIGKGIYLMGDNWIGANSVICDDVTIGKGAVIEANSTVTKSIPLASIAVGTPAKVIKKRYSGDWDFHKVERASFEGMPRDVSEHVRRRGMLIRELINARDCILDVGCGEGIITAILAEKSQNVVGCDYSIEALDIAKTMHPHIKFVYSNSTNLTFNDESFTKVTMSDVAEHLLPVQFLKTLGQINRVLKKGGEVILATPITGKGKNVSTYAHIYEYSAHEMRNILTKIFSNVKLVNEKFGLFIAKKRGY